MGPVIGKPIGIVHINNACRPHRNHSLIGKIAVRQLFGLSLLGGIEFTMFKFVASAGFGSGRGGAHGEGHFDFAVNLPV